MRKTWYRPTVVETHPPSISGKGQLELRRKVLADNSDQARKVGDALRIRDAKTRSAYDDYIKARVVLPGPPGATTVIPDGAIEAAHNGNVSRLVDCLRGRKPITDADRVVLANYIATKRRRRYWPPDLKRVLNRSALTEDDYNLLANLVEKIGRGPGGVVDAPAHRAARLARGMMSVGLPRTAAIDRACEIEAAQSGVGINTERVRNLLDHPKRGQR